MDLSAPNTRPHSAARFFREGARTPRSGPGSVYRASTTAFHVPAAGGQKYFRSRRIKDVSTISKPWTDKKDTSAKWYTIFPAIGIFLGLALVALACFEGYKSVTNHDYCLILDEDFSRGLSTDVWTKEAELGGYGNGQFEETTLTDENVFIKDGQLIIKPTLQDEKLVNENNVKDLGKDCTAAENLWKNCHAATNTTNGTIINPVKSGRINTKKGAIIQYGRVEVTAKMPEGDWLWPAIWMLPVNHTYGAWPASGEIDIAESRGNNYSYPMGGNDVVTSTLHWGPDPSMDAWYKTFEKKNALHTTFSAKFNRYGLEWSDKYIFTYINSRLMQALYVSLDKPLWPKGKFESSTQNGTRIVDPWSQTGRTSTPFDQPFYLILNVAVGSTNGWWMDGVDGKPWVDASPTAKKDFWDARSQWLPTWEKAGEMAVSKVKIWQQAGYRGCAGK